MNYINKILDFRKAVFDKIEKKHNNQIWRGATLEDIKKIVLIQSAPRSGSSFLFAVLRRASGVCSLSGECNPFYKLNRLASDSFPSDRIPDELIQEESIRFGMSRDFLSDFSSGGNNNDIIHNSDALEQYINNLVLRFYLQWPQISFSYDLFRKLTLQAFDAYAKSFKKFYEVEFYLELFKSLRTVYQEINPYYYDIAGEIIKKRFPELRVSSGPPNSNFLIEEPPFILLSPRKKINKEDLSGKIFLLKSPVNCYRMNYIRALFPNAEIKLIYLTRNPLASVNGLYDGWLYNRGFFSHNLETFFKNNKTELKSLKIIGYSNRYKWGKWWWNFDLPPGWQDYAESRLEEVCAFQWHSAHQAIQEDIQHNKIKICQFKYENIVKNSVSLKKEIEKMMQFIGLSMDKIKELNLERLPVVQLTNPPQPYRWEKRKDILLPILKNPKIARISGVLGYDKESFEEWL